MKGWPSLCKGLKPEGGCPRVPNSVSDSIIAFVERTLTYEPPALRPKRGRFAVTEGIEPTTFPGGPIKGEDQGCYYLLSFRYNPR